MLFIMSCCKFHNESSVSVHALYVCIMSDIENENIPAVQNSLVHTDRSENNGQ